VSENAKLIFDEKFPQYSNKTNTFNNIVSKSNLEQLASEGETFSDNYEGLKILTLGRLSIEKGQQMIPDIVYKLKLEGLKFRWYIIGNGNLFNDLKAQIKQLNIDNELVLLGSKLNPYCYVKNCDLYVQTSFHEGYCLTVHEAKIFDKPVVVTNVASASNLIVNNKDGLIVPISSAGIYKGLRTLLLDTERRTAFAQNLIAKETVNEINKLVKLIK
jgi:glycosyltransferase involved in cell wall biosynthesis